MSDCYTTDGNRTGICVRSMMECTQRGGRAMGNCYAMPLQGMNSNNQGNSNMNWQTSQQGMPVGICCFCKLRQFN